MENIENTTPKADKVAETLAKELESLSAEGLHEFFKFVYKMNHMHGNMMTTDSFEDFLSNFDDNPFKINDSKEFKKQFIENVIKHTFDPKESIVVKIECCTFINVQHSILCNC